MLEAFRQEKKQAPQGSGQRSVKRAMKQSKQNADRYGDVDVDADEEASTCNKVILHFCNGSMINDDSQRPGLSALLSFSFFHFPSLVDSRCQLLGLIYCKRGCTTTAEEHHRHERDAIIRSPICCLVPSMKSL